MVSVLVVGLRRERFNGLGVGVKDCVELKREGRDFTHSWVGICVILYG